MEEEAKFADVPPGDETPVFRRVMEKGYEISVRPDPKAVAVRYYDPTGTYESYRHSFFTTGAGVKGPGGELVETIFMAECWRMQHRRKSSRVKWWSMQIIAIDRNNCAGLEPGIRFDALPYVGGRIRQIGGLNVIVGLALVDCLACTFVYETDQEEGLRVVFDSEECFPQLLLGNANGQVGCHISYQGSYHFMRSGTCENKGFRKLSDMLQNCLVFSTCPRRPPEPSSDAKGATGEYLELSRSDIPEQELMQ